MRSPASSAAGRPIPGLKSFAFEDGLVLWDRATSRILAFNAATAAIWPKIEAARSRSQIAGDLARRYALTLDRARNDVDALFAELSRLHVLVSSPFAPKAKDGGAQPADSTSPPLAQLMIRLAGLRLSIEADVEVIAFLRDLFHGRTSADDKADRSIRVAGPALNAAVSLDGTPRGVVRSREETIGAIYELVLEALHPNVNWLALFHASAVARGNIALLFPAPSGNGKSTLVTSLVRDGYDYLSDDLVGISEGDHRVWPFPLGINLKRGSRDLVAIPRGFEAIEITGAARRDRILAPPSKAWAHPPVCLHAVVFPRYVAGGAPKLEKLTAIDALTRLLTDRVHLGDPLTDAPYFALLALGRGDSVLHSRLQRPCCGQGTHRRIASVNPLGSLSIHLRDIARQSRRAAARHSIWRRLASGHRTGWPCMSSRR